MEPKMIVRIVANLSELKKAMAEGASVITTTTAGMQKLASSLDGSRLEQRAHNIVAAVNKVGGATNLTGAEAKRLLTTLDEWIAKAKRLGREVPADVLKTRDALARTNDEFGKMPGKLTGISSGLSSLAAAFGVTFSIGALVGFGRELLRMGDEIQKMADKTSLSTDEVQRLSFVADQTGVSIEGIVGAVQNLQQRLGTGDDGAVGALKSLGINARDFLALNPYDQFLKISEAVGKIEDPTRRAAVMAGVFGKSWKELGPVVIANVKGIADAAPVMSQKTVKALDDAGDALSKFSLTAKVAAAEFYLYLGRAFDLAIARTYTYIAELQESLAGVYRALAKIPGASRMFPTLDSDIKGLTESAKWYRDAAAGMAQQTEQVTDKVRAAIVPMEALTKAKKTGKTAAEEYAQVLKRIRDAQIPLTEAQKASVDQLQKLGISHSDIAKYLKVSDIAVKSYTDKQEALNKIIKEQIDLLPRLKTNLAELNIGAGMTPQLAFVPVSALMSALVAKLNEEFARLMADPEQWIRIAKQSAGKTGTQAGTEMSRTLWEQFSDRLPNDAAGFISSGIGQIAAALEGKEGGFFGRLKTGILASAADFSKFLAHTFVSSFSSLGPALDQLAPVIDSLITDLFKGNFKGVGNTLKGFADTFVKDFTKEALSMIPGIGPALSQLAGPIVDGLKKLFSGLFGIGNAGRDVVKDFAASFGGFDALHVKLNALGDEGERLWIALTQGVGRNNPEQARAAVDAVTAALKAHEQAAKDSATAAEEAASAQIAAANSVTDALKESLSALGKQRDGLVASIANEAHEEVMGVIETETRARIAAIETEMSAKEEQINQAQAAAEQATQDIKDQATEVNDHIRRLFSDPIRIPIRWEMPELPEGPSGDGGFAHGTPGLSYSDFGASTPTYLHGREAVIPEGRVGELAAQIAGAMGGSRQNGRVMVPIVVQVDRRNLLEIVAEGALQ